MTSLADLEPYVQNVIQLFLRRIDEVSEGGEKPFDIGAWVQYFAFDALGEVNFSEQLGFLETGTDVGNSIATIDGLLKYLSIIGQAPWLHKFLLGNPLLHRFVPFFETSNEVQNVSYTSNRPSHIAKYRPVCHQDDQQAHQRRAD